MVMYWSKVFQTRPQNGRHLLLMVFIFHQIHCDMDSSCSNGLEYDCKTVKGDGKACVLSCNSTVTNIISPGYCTDGCCKLCYSDCQECVYIRILTFCIHSSNTSWTEHLLDRTSKQYNSLDKDIRGALLDVLYSINQTFFKIELMQVKRYSKSSVIIQVYVKITSRKQAKQTLAINILRNRTKNGQLGELIVLPHVFEVMTEKEFAMLENHKGQEADLDVVELIATCVGALIILAAIGWCLFYLCTTAHQREQCNPCHRNRINT